MKTLVPDLYALFVVDLEFGVMMAFVLTNHEIKTDPGCDEFRDWLFFRFWFYEYVCFCSFAFILVVVCLGHDEFVCDLFK